MKKVRIAAVTLLMGVLLFALTACGGATGTLSSFVSAVKKADFEKASTYIVGKPSLKNPSDKEGEMYQYIFEKCAGSFSYKVEEESMNSDETACTVKISYSGYSGNAVTLAYGLKVISGIEATKSTVDSIIKEMDKKEGTTSVILVKNDDGDWLLEAASAVALTVIIFG